MKRWALILSFVLSGSIAEAIPIYLSDVPSYTWYHGCSPTTGAMILGYWDLHGYSNLFNAAGDDIFLTSNVMDEISSPAHNAKYNPKPDNPDLSEPPDTSIADFMHTSEGSLNYGSTYASLIPAGITQYALYRGYDFQSAYVPVSWETLMSEINLGRPVKLGIQGHSLAGFGYDQRDDGSLWYAAYNTYHEEETIDWYPFESILNLAYVHPLYPNGLPVVLDKGININETPEPSAMILSGIGMIFIGFYARKKRTGT